MEGLSYTRKGTYLFRFMDHRTTYFWPTVVDMLSNHTLFLNSRKNFNDPFDSQPIVKNDLSNSALRNYLNRATKDPFNPERSFAATANILEMEAHGKAALPKHRLAEIKEASARALKGF